MLMRSILVTCLCLFSISSVARTYGVPAYMADPGANLNYKFGEFVVNSNYQDPDFTLGESLASPLNDSRFKSYNVIIIVNKTTKGREPGQTMRVYVRDAGLLYFWHISTARAGKLTPSGFFRPQLFSSAHQSTRYNNAPMPWTVFFNGHIGTHGVLGDKISHLGSPASAGCVRMEPQRGKDLFHLIGQNGQGEVDAISPMGEVVMGDNGKPVQVFSYKTLIIIK